jgi:hypothetical protein
MAHVPASEDASRPIHQRRARRNVPTAVDWQVQRERISNLYKHHTLAQVGRIMAREHNFHATYGSHLPWL